MATLGPSSTIARRIILRAQQTRYKGMGIGHYSPEAVFGQGWSNSFPQAEIEASDYESFFRFFPDYLVKDALREKEVLDFGSGFGGRTVEYKLCGAKRVCGIELLEDVVIRSQRYAEYRGVHGVEFKICSNKEIPYPDASFDIVISYDVLEHVEDPRISVAEIRRVLRPGGLSLNVFPVYFGARSHHLDYITSMPGLHWLFSARTLVTAVNSILAENSSFGVPLQPQPRRSFDGSRYVLPKLNGLSGSHFQELFDGFEVISMERWPLYWWDPGIGRIAGAVARSRFPTIVRDAATNNIACVLRKPGPRGAIPLPAANDFSITPLKETRWTLIQPARLAGGSIIIRGAVPFAQAYAAVSPDYRLPRGARVAAAGSVRRGGITLGLLNSNDQFAAQIAIPSGKFRRFIDAPVKGTYRIVIANNLPAGQRTNDAEISEVGLIGLDPDTVRVALPPANAAKTQPARRFEITALEETAWESIVAPARREGQTLVIEGEPPFPAAYAAVSGRYRLPQGALVGAAGTVRQGGIELGLLDAQERWAVKTAVPQGTFRITVQVPADGEYRIVIANNLPAGQGTSDAEITEVGLVGVDPATLRVASSQASEARTKG